MEIFTDEYFMREALKEAHAALIRDEIPIGAVVVSDNVIIGKGHNMTEQLNDVTAHAEMLAFTAAALYLNSKYLYDCTLYVTIEPCVMCAGAAFWTQIPRIVYGAPDPKRGYSRFPLLHPVTRVTGGILQIECGKLLSDYFRDKR